MKLNQGTKGNISALVEEYKKIFPQEFYAFEQQMKRNFYEQSNDYGEIKGSDMVERKLVEYPETLYAILMQKLSQEDFVWFSSKKGVRWLAKKHPEFKVVNKI